MSRSDQREGSGAASARIGWEDLGAAEQAWFAGHAGGALERRGRPYFAEMAARWRGWILTGAVGLAGLLLLDWPVLTALLLLLATFWLAWLADVALLVLRAGQLPAAYACEHADARFSILRGTRRTLPDAAGGPSLLLSVMVDLVAGAASMALLVRGLAGSSAEVLQAANSWSLWLGAAAVLVTSIAPALRARLSARGAACLPVFRAGQRGIGLLLLVFALMAIGGGVLAAHWMMAAVYGFMLLMGAIESAFGVPRIREETEWFRGERSRQGVPG